jgi:hypothetical protein
MLCTAWAIFVAGAICGVVLTQAACSLGRTEVVHVIVTATPSATVAGAARATPLALVATSTAPAPTSTPEPTAIPTATPQPTAIPTLTPSCPEGYLYDQARNVCAACPYGYVYNLGTGHCDPDPRLAPTATPVVIVVPPPPSSNEELDELRVVKVLDDNKIIVDRRYQRLLIEYGTGCLGMWRYEGRTIYLVGSSSRYRITTGSKLLLPNGDTCRIWSWEEL